MVDNSLVAAPEKPASDSVIGPFWRRLIAYLADSVILGLPCMIIAIPIFDLLSKMGYMAKLIGFLIGLVYFGIFDSKIKNGQSPGKRWRSLRVVDSGGNPLSPGKAMLRYTILTVPIYLNGTSFPTATAPLALVLMGLIFGVGGITLYLLLFNRNTRQGLHDLAVKSFVVKSEKTRTVQHLPVWRGHWIVIGIYLCLLVFGAGYMTYKIPKTPMFPAMMENIRLIQAMDGVSGAGIQDLVRSQIGSGKSQRILMVNVQMWKHTEDGEKFAILVANTLLDKYPNAKNHDLIQINLSRGYDMGVASWHHTEGFEHAPAEWRLCLTSPSKSK